MKIGISYKIVTYKIVTDGQTDNYSLPPHLSPLRSFLTKVKTDLSTIFGQESLGMLLHMAV